MGVIQRQGIKNAITTYVGIIIGFITLIFVYPHYLTKEEVGLIRLLFFFSSMVAVFVPLGIHTTTMRFFPNFRNEEKRHHGYFGFMIIFPIAGFIIISILLLIFKPIVIEYYIEKSPLFTHYFYSLFPYILILGLIVVLHSYAFSLLKTTVPSFINDVFVRIALIGLAIAYFYNWFDLDHLVYYSIGVYAFQLVLLLLYIIYEDRPTLTIDFKYLKSQDLRSMMRYGLALSLPAIASLGIKFIDSIILGHYKDLEVVGVYTLVAFIPTVIEAPLTALEKIAGPKIAGAYASDNKTEMKDIYYKSSKYLLLLGGLLFVGINASIKYLFQLTGNGFLDAGVHVVFIISIGTLINMATGVNDSIIFYSKKYIYGTYMLYMLFILAVLNNIILIPIFGMEGAALATVISSFIYNLVKYLFIWKTFKLQPFGRHTMLTVLLIGVCFTLNYFLPAFNGPILNILFRSAVITIAYVAGAYFLNIAPEFHHYIPFIKKRNS